MKKVILLLLSAFFFCGLSAQTTVEKKESGTLIINIDPQKPKALKSLIDKTEYANISQLKVSGPLKEKDIQLIFDYLTNLEALDLLGATLPYTYKYSKKADTELNNDIFYLPSYSIITKLGVPGTCETLQNQSSNDLKILSGKRLRTITGKETKVDIFYVDDTDYSTYGYMYKIFYELDFRPRIFANTQFMPDNYHLKKDNMDNLQIIVNGDRGSDSYPHKHIYRYRTIDKKRNINTHVLIANDNSNTSDIIEPVLLILLNKDCISLVNHSGTSSAVKLSDYEKYVDRIDDIEPYAFYGHFEIDSIDLNVNGLTYIGAYAFAGTKFTSITIPESITQISPSAFDGSLIEEVIVESKYPPIIKEKYEGRETDWKVGDTRRIDRIQFIIPQNSKERYSIGDWKQLHIREAGAQTDYELTIEIPGTLSDFINDENASNIINLTLKGFLDDTDYEALKKCKNLNKLDMSHCFTIISEKTQKAERDKEQAELAILQALYGLATEEAERQYNRGETSIGTVLETHTVKNYLDEIQKLYDNNQFVADKNCKMPYKALEGLSVLKEFAYPVQLLSACVSLPGSIEKVTLPPMATEIGGFGGCKKLKTILVPSSVTSIKSYSFKGCNIDELDLSNTQITEFPEESFENCHVTVFKAPKGLKRMCCGYKFTTDNAWYYTQEPPTCFRFEGKMIHIPRGTKAGWSSVDKRIIIIDDIISE